MDEITKETQHKEDKRLNTVRNTSPISLKQVLINNFVGGIAWALGISFGASIILALLGFLFHKINLIPIVGNFIIDINQFIAQNSNVFGK